MVLAELEQKKRFSRRKYILYEDRIALEIKSAEATSKYEVDIMDTGDKLHYHAENIKGGKTILACVFLIPIILTTLMFVRHNITSGQVAAAWFCCFVFLFLAYIKEHTDDVYLTGGQKNINFFRDIPSEQKVLDFIELIKKTKRDNLRKEYLAFDSDTDEGEYYTRLKWLREQNLITYEEYDNAKIDFEIKRLF